MLLDGWKWLSGMADWHLGGPGHALRQQLKMTWSRGESDAFLSKMETMTSWIQVSPCHIGIWGIGGIGTHTFLILAFAEGKWLASWPHCFICWEKSPGTHGDPHSWFVHCGEERILLPAIKPVSSRPYSNHYANWANGIIQVYIKLDWQIPVQIHQ
jgi:hypothetical protein